MNNSIGLFPTQELLATAIGSVEMQIMFPSSTFASILTILKQNNTDFYARFGNQVDKFIANEEVFSQSFSVERGVNFQDQYAMLLNAFLLYVYNIVLGNLNPEGSLYYYLDRHQASFIKDDNGLFIHFSSEFRLELTDTVDINYVSTFVASLVNGALNIPPAFAITDLRVATVFVDSNSEKSQPVIELKPNMMGANNSKTA